MFRIYFSGGLEIDGKGSKRFNCYSKIVSVWLERENDSPRRKYNLVVEVIREIDNSGIIIYRYFE